ncbi:ShlB/FhaC/HecB family hemolysin secretion/activation protein [Niveispirillum sp. BGYR6]|uniref:ShlB/FhaC/HecB family hemolysin secretion/activation protein n=1 Tax=Niveispirillum sp. BGYR6 TaxID=2971249 RepID=UPI0022B9AD2D|nr:ShlB/FhaC/HecB family hemolysin secretion/activation protein [Niveispirillum sp. BGYR6]MDG5496928.1 ShlB/FhaC/HecB family hemolysin secretion/activation protein [Niveispirillum sp. BGYR6]
MRKKKVAVAVAALLMSGVGVNAMGQDAGQILRDVERNIPKPPPPTPSVPNLAPALPDDDFLKEGQTVRVTGFKIEASLIAEKELQAELASYVGRDCTLGDLKEAAARISRYYAKRDLLARAVLPRQTLEGGIVTIQVLEARMGRVKIDPTSKARLNPAQAEAFIHAQNPQGDAVRPGAIATGVSNLGIIPGLQAIGILDAGEQEGTTDVILKIQEPAMFSSTLVVDNNSAAEIGRLRGLAIATLTDASGYGEQASLIGQATKSSRYGQLVAGAPVLDGRFWLEGSGAALAYDIPRSVNVTQPAGNAQTAGLTVRWLALQTSGEPVNLSLGVEHKWTQDKVGGLTTASNRLAGLTFSARRVMRDQWQGGGAFVLDAALKVGNVDLSRNATNKALDRATADTQGNYAKLTLSASRRQALWQGGDLQISLSGQLASKNLNSAEQFSLGGMSGTRGYPVNAGSGDQGAMLGVELGHMLLDNLRVATFWDGGLIQQHKERWTGWEGVGSPHNTYFQHDVGASVQWLPLDNMQLKTTLAKRVGPDAGRGLDLKVANERRAEMRAWMQLVLTV